MLRFFRAILVALTASLLLSSAAFATVPYYGEFSYWYSDASKIGQFSNYSNSVGMSIAGGCGMLAGTLTTSVDYALSAWSLQNYSYTDASDYATADLKIACISRSTANSLGVPSNYAGFTFWDGESLIGTGTWFGASKNIYSVPRYQIYYVWDTCSCSNNTSSLSLTVWKGIAAHEHGHGAGYWGHNTSDSTQLMYPSRTSVTSPQTKDKNHLRNLYTVN
jgi:hypothetical protein